MSKGRYSPEAQFCVFVYCALLNSQSKRSSRTKPRLGHVVFLFQKSVPIFHTSASFYSQKRLIEHATSGKFRHFCVHVLSAIKVRRVAVVACSTGGAKCFHRDARKKTFQTQTYAESFIYFSFIFWFSFQLLVFGSQFKHLPRVFLLQFDSDFNSSIALVIENSSTPNGFIKKHLSLKLKIREINKNDCNQH